MEKKMENEVEPGIIMFLYMLAAARKSAFAGSEKVLGGSLATVFN